MLCDWCDNKAEYLMLSKGLSPDYACEEHANQLEESYDDVQRIREE